MGTDWGYYATYSVNTTALVLAMLYTQFVCKEHPDGNYIIRKKKNEDQEEKEISGRWWAKHFEPTMHDD